MKNFFAKLFRRNNTIRTDVVSVFCIPRLDFSFIYFRPSPAAMFMNFRMAIAAKQFQILKVQSDLRIVYVHRIQFNYVMYDLARLVYPFTQTVFAKIMFPPGVFVPAILPRLRTIKLTCEGPAHIYTLPEIFYGYRNQLGRTRTNYLRYSHNRHHAVHGP